MGPPMAVPTNRGGDFGDLFQTGSAEYAVEKIFAFSFILDFEFALEFVFQFQFQSLSWSAIVLTSFQLMKTFGRLDLRGKNRLVISCGEPVRIHWKLVGSNVQPKNLEPREAADVKSNQFAPVVPRPGC
jgi:hypothetical protein